MKGRWLVLFCLFACGDAMVDGSYLGEPHLRVEGMFRGSTGEATIHAPQLGIIWATPDGNHEIAKLDIRLTAIFADPLATTFSFEVWDLPPRSALVPICGTRIATGTLAVYDDVNRDGRIDLEFDDESLRVVAPDKALGMGDFYYLLYVEDSIEDCEFLPGAPRRLGPGFHVIAIHGCESWESAGAFVEVRLFPPADVFPSLPTEFEDC